MTSGQIKDTRKAHIGATGTIETPIASVAAGEVGQEFLVTTFKNSDLTEAVLTRQEVLALDPEEVDFFWNCIFGRISIRRPDGTIPELDGAIPGLGPDAGIPFLEDILWGLGELLTVERFNGTLESLRFSGPRAALVRRLRRAFGDSAALQWYFIVKARPWRIGWSMARSWRILERLARPSSGNRSRA